MNYFYLTPGSQHLIDIGQVVSQHSGKFTLAIPPVSDTLPGNDVAEMRKTIDALQEQVRLTLEVVADLRNVVETLQRPVIQYETQF